MSELLWQATLLLALAFFIGGAIACGLKRAFYYPRQERKSAPSIAPSGIPNAPAATEPKIEVTPRPAPEGERFNRAISGQSSSAAAAAAAAAGAIPVPAAAAPVAPAAAKPVSSISVSSGSGAPVVATDGGAAPSDDLTRIRGIDTVVQKRLKDLGLRRYEDLARLTAIDVKGLERSLGYSGRIDDENWVGQAQILATGGETYYSRRVDKGLPIPPTANPAGMARTVAAVATAAAIPVATRSFAKVGSVTGDGDDLTRIRGIDAGLNRQLNEVGILRFSDLAALGAGDARVLEQTLGITNRILPENWIGQAEVLAAGGETYYSRSRDRAAASAETPAPATEAAPAQAAMTPEPAPAPAAVPLTEQPASEPDIVTKVEAPVPAPAASPATVAIPVVAAPAPQPTAPAEPAPPPAATAAPAEAAASEPAAADDAAGSLPYLRSVRSETLIGAEAARTPLPDTVTDDLKRIRGIGVLIEKKLNSLGITHYEQVANWTGADIERISRILDFKGRIERENWIEQARILATGGQTEFSRRNEG
jgi:predicted flap endonuclease-1-like 5' DNA nuclease